MKRHRFIALVALFSTILNSLPTVSLAEERMLPVTPLQTSVQMEPEQEIPTVKETKVKWLWWTLGAGVLVAAGAAAAAGGGGGKPTDGVRVINNQPSNQGNVKFNW